MAKQVVWTKRCADGSVCRSNIYAPDALKRGGSLKPIGQTEPAFIADENTICDACLLARFDLFGEERYDGCGDPLSMCPLYDRDDVIRALRQATGE